MCKVQKEQDNTQQERLYNNEPNPEEIRYSEHKRPTNVGSPVPIVLVSGWLKHRRGGSWRSLPSPQLEVEVTYPVRGQGLPFLMTMPNAQ